MITVSRELSSKQPLTWCFLPFVVAPGIDFTWTIDFEVFPSFYIFRDRATYNECPFSVVDITLILWRMVCTVISIRWFFPFSVWLLLCDGVLLRGLPSLRIIFNCSPDVISRSFVSTDFAVFMLFFWLNVSDIMIWMNIPYFIFVFD